MQKYLPECSSKDGNITTPEVKQALLCLFDGLTRHFEAVTYLNGVFREAVSSVNSYEIYQEVTSS